MCLNARILIAVTIVALSGCDAARNIGRSPEERVNEARPVLAETLEARKSLEAMLARDAKGSADLQRELATRDKVRALTCAKGFSPSLFQTKDEVAKSLTDQQCFDDYDRETLQWLKGRQLHSLLTAGPLRAVPSTPVAIFATAGGVNTIRFAAEAPIAVCTSNNTVEVIDVGSGESLFLDRNLSQHPSAVAISPNGRVFAVGGSNGLSLREAENGEVLLDLPDYQRFVWLDRETGLAIKRTQAAVDLIDFANNARTVAVRGIDAIPSSVLPLAAAQPEFLLSSPGTIARYALKRDAKGVQATLLDQKTGPPMGWSENTSAVTIDDAWFVQASNELWVTNLRTLVTEHMPIGPFYARAVTPMPDPDEVMLFGSFSSGSGAAPPLVYSISNHTFTPVEDDQLTAMPGYSALRTVFVPALKRVAVVTGSKVKLLDELKRGPKYGPEALVQLFAEEQRIQQERNAIQVAAREGFQLDRIVNGIPVASGPMLEAARDATVEAVGVYESAHGSHGIGKPSVPGPVTVTLRRSDKPIVLVLSSYEPVLWSIVGARSANLKAVLLGGYSPSTVAGEEGVRVTQIGRLYAYERGSGFEALQREVITRTGKGIDTFQGTYSGTSFVVGGR
jgi:hypothetical protein